MLARARTREPEPGSSQPALPWPPPYNVNSMNEAAMAGGIEFLKWLRLIGRERATGYRWAEKKWIEPCNIAGKLYVTQADILQFWQRAKAGEFAQEPGGVCAVRDRGGG